MDNQLCHFQNQLQHVRWYQTVWIAVSKRRKKYGCNSQMT